ncbi:MAG: hypothetical protein S4CHLAM2_10380 [Chlamydiales bacterium]|nr:hypothetical protein [Chlamydiales bacterium]
MLPVTTKGELTDRLESASGASGSFVGRDIDMISAGVRIGVCIGAIGLLGAWLGIMFVAAGYPGLTPAIMGTTTTGASVALYSFGMASILGYFLYREATIPLTFEQVQELLQEEKRHNKSALWMIEWLERSYQVELKGSAD